MNTKYYLFLTFFILTFSCYSVNSTPFSTNIIGTPTTTQYLLDSKCIFIISVNINATEEIEISDLSVESNIKNYVTLAGDKLDSPTINDAQQVFNLEFHTLIGNYPLAFILDGTQTNLSNVQCLDPAQFSINILANTAPVLSLDGQAYFLIKVDTNSLGSSALYSRLECDPNFVDITCMTTQLGQPYSDNILVSLNRVQQTKMPAKLPLNFSILNSTKVTITINNPFKLAFQTANFNYYFYPYLNATFEQDPILIQNLITQVGILEGPLSGNTYVYDEFGQTYTPVKQDTNTKTFVVQGNSNQYHSLLENDTLIATSNLYINLRTIDDIFVSNPIANVYSENDFDIVNINLKTKQFYYNEITSNSYQIVTKYPISNSQSEIVYSLSYPVRKSRESIEIELDAFPYNGLLDTIGGNSSVIPSNISIETLNVTRVSKLFNVRIQFNSANPIRQILVNGISLTLSDLVSGTPTNGVLEKSGLGQQSASDRGRVIAYDQMGYSIVFEKDYILTPGQQKVPKPFITESFGLFNINFLQFAKNDFDLTVGNGVNNTLYIGLNNSLSADGVLPSLFLGSDTFYSKEFQGYYDTYNKVYYINFEIPPSEMAGQLEYSLSNGYQLFSSNIIQSVIGKNATLRISKSDGNSFPPFLENVQRIKDLYSYNMPMGPIQWNLTISDSPNGFSFGTVDVISNLDLEPTTLTFDSRNLTFGTSNNGTYLISYTPSYCINIQNFTLTNMKLYHSKLKETNQHFDPLVSVYASPKQDELTIYVTCIDILTDNKAPEIVSFSVTKSVDVGSKDRKIEVNIKIFDTIGISPKHNPIIHLTSSYPNVVIPIKTQLQVADASGNTYNGSYYLPFGYGEGSAFILEVVGLVDNRLNYRGFTPYDLKNNSYTYFITRKFTINEPILEATSDVTTSTTQILVSGRSFGNNQQSLTSFISYDDGDFENADSTFMSSTLLFIKKTSSSAKVLKIFVLIDGRKSNTLTIPISTIPPPSIEIFPTPTPIPTRTSTPTQTQTQTPTPTPTLTCPGTPQCFGRGECTINGCECRHPYYGPSCSSELVPVPPPVKQPDPTTNNTIPTSNGNPKVTTEMKIATIREIDGNQNFINFFEPKEWIVEDRSTEEHTFYHYSTQLNQTNTYVNISIEYFKIATNVTFGQQNYTMLPSSTKFTIRLSKYDFAQATNFLRIEMDVSMKSDTTQKTCSSNVVGTDSNNNIQWIKMNIDKTSLYGRFIPYAVIDSREQAIKNIIIDHSDNPSATSSKIGIIIPQYEDNVIIDPDFSHLVDVADDGQSQTCEKKDSNVNKKIIIGVVVGVVGAALVVTLVTFIIKKYGFRNMKIKLIELKSLSKR